MLNENASPAVKALKITSYLLLISGILMVLPYPLFYSLKIILRASGVRSFSPGFAFMMFLVAGQLVLCIPLLSISISALWVYRQTGSHDRKFHVLSRGFFRYSPALALGFFELIYTTTTEKFYIPGVFGALLIVYAWFLLKLDSKGGDCNGPKNHIDAK